MSADFSPSLPKAPKVYEAREKPERRVRPPKREILGYAIAVFTGMAVSAVAVLLNLGEGLTLAFAIVAVIVLLSLELPWAMGVPPVWKWRRNRK